MFAYILAKHLTLRMAAMPSYGDFARAITTMMTLIIHHTKLSWRHPVYGFLGMYHQATVCHTFYCGRVAFWSMAYLEGDMMHVHLASKEVEVMQREIFFISSLRIITMTHIKDVLLHIFFHNKPRASTKAKSLTLTDGVIP